MLALRRGRECRGVVGEGLLTRPLPSAEGDGRTGWWRGAAATSGVRTLYCDQVSAQAIADEVGTPVYVYSASMIRAQYQRLTQALRRIPHRLHYSVKANSNLALLSLLRELGAGVDIVSAGELFRALRAGYGPGDVVFSGVGKTADELRQAVEVGVRLINVESVQELHLLDRIAGELRRRAAVAIRVNPEVTVETPHAYTRTGERGHKFGIPFDEALPACRLALALSNVELVGLDMHIGSQIADVESYTTALARLLELHETLRASGAPPIRLLDIGGGLSVPYQDEDAADVDAFAEAIVSAVVPTGLELIVEPGRFLVGNAGVLLTRVLYRKRSGGKEYVITDAGMNDLLRPSHYQAYHEIEAVAQRGPRHIVDVVGPVCETGDFLALDRPLELVAPGELLAVHSAGAYGFVMSSNYNSRPRPAEVMVDGSRYATVRGRESHEDLVRHEVLPPAWRSA